MGLSFDLDFTQFARSGRPAIMKIVFALVVVGLSSQAYGHAVGSVPFESGQASKYCTDCVNFIGDLKEVLSSPTSAADIEKLLDQMVCANMGRMQIPCRALMKTLVPRFMHYLAQMPDGKQICGLIGMCRDSAVTLLNENQQQSSGKDCDLCRTVLDDLRSFAEKVQLKDVLENQVCPLLGGLSDKCKENAESNAAQIFHLLKPALLCNSTNLCKQQTGTNTVIGSFRVTWNTKPSNVKVMSQLKVKGGIQCTLCEFAIKEIEQLLANKETLDAIEKALETMCNFLPPSMSHACDAFVQEYIPMIVKLLQQKIPPERICHMIHLC